MDVTIGLAFGAGLASFLSPCVLPLVPAYIGYLSGRALAEGGGSQKSQALLHGFAFVLGFSLVFIFLGLATSALGGLLYSIRHWLAVIGGIVVVIFGIHMTGIVRIPWLEYDIRPDAEVSTNMGLLSSALMGVFFSAGWSPCVGPVLGAILTIALNGGSIAQGGVLLTAYSAGLAIPFLLAALSIDWVTTILQKYSRLSRIVEIIMGVVLIIVGLMLVSGTFSYLSRLGNFFNLGL